jgi:hypothetical protein
MPAAATNSAPSADEATAVQLLLGAPLARQLEPASVEMKIGPESAATASFVPSAEEATVFQDSLGRLFEVQVTPESAEV